MPEFFLPKSRNSQQTTHNVQESTVNFGPANLENAALPQTISNNTILADTSAQESISVKTASESVNNKQVSKNPTFLSQIPAATAPPTSNFIIFPT